MGGRIGGRIGGRRELSTNLIRTNVNYVLSRSFGII